MGKSGKVPGGWKASLAQVLKEHNGLKRDGTVASAATADKRSDVLFKGFQDLRDAGYKLENVTSFRGKHMEVLAKQWEAKGLSPSTIQNNISTFRTFAGWIGKTGMVEGADRYVSAGHASRSGICKEDKSWQGKGVDIEAKIAEVTALDARVGIQLELCDGFGLRPREAMQLLPHLADKGNYLAVNLGSKGGRDRTVTIRTPEQRALLERAKEIAGIPGKSTSDPALKLAQVKNHFYYVCRQAGLTKKELGATAHGLRHGFAHSRYKEETGRDSPLRGGGNVPRGLDRSARLAVAEDLGHSRESITPAYLGR